ncbi:RluA family pseudouridine synthase [bacterium (Candidatus Blackallbacteria) CG17_big_fil_post_rev_8_21_14_2_50_48_46]|uniref:Pseudouridine synthase n=1 Tax=bacterium (Candidatus Blackallbacteria) CG17_big_fil_post_rev_8_21_14_2_50_48_46 TaxID=2014261 RepID=A0A2M7G4A5_9BACT|nr:MAG: RluA family pseudouridine synthase [bacterium (Candidatus Blackallbacteria) CG18_big_fil_WC_8_21_14_2_50_49_26]PIW16699.1 MAG: RluA family pseudouridine synthase [bacterium (Candidatus Blackallbacteria) CG17_big_fil_post_rev_8_21_14_2_50_48_46]PIW46205.1 MAG: RluA family pseudouridine synthase [bacterium (Candidatus Blackallbacteria) CG13_big_fil_rev_8_21_14_2_50_49_14]
MPQFTIPAEWHKTRLDQVLIQLLPELSRAYCKKLVQQGQIQLNAQVVSKAGQILREGDLLQWELPELQPLEIQAEAMDLDIVYEDPHLLVINKPVGLVVHPGAGNPSGTLVNALLHHCTDLSGIGGVERPGIVHRLDKETSGLLVVAKHDQAHRHLSEQLQRRDMKRIYWALAELAFAEQSGEIEAPIDRHPVERQKMAIVEDGRFARTHWTVLEHFTGYTLLELSLDTGRTHQIRVHLKHIHHPLVGDPVYGSSRKHAFKVSRPLLHARFLRFFHPVSGEFLEFEAPLPQDFERILTILRERTHKS